MLKEQTNEDLGVRDLVYPNIVEPAVKGEGAAQKTGEAGEN
jgi:hypothetical protein